MSLRYKILTALTVLPLVGMTLFLALAVTIFEKDKIAYVFDSSLSVSKTKAARIRSEISALLSVTQSVVYSFGSSSQTLAESGMYFFTREPKFEAFKIFTLSAETGHYEPVVNLQKPTAEATLTAEAERMPALVQAAIEKTVAVYRPIDRSARIVLALRFGDVSDPKHLVALGVFQGSEFSEAFDAEGAFMSVLLRKSGENVFGPVIRDEGGGEWALPAIVDQLPVNKIPEGIAEIRSPSKQVYLASFVAVGLGDMYVVSLVGRKTALQAVDTLLRKSILFFIALLASTTLISVLASNQLTSALRHLLVATQKVAEGDFAVRVNVKARDEVGSLATSFNAMAHEVSRLMEETADKARMESELATARTVQETLFPENLARIGPVEIAGHYQPASECGGDWWYYCENGDNVYLWIGDATGHGAPAALITSAARAVASVIQCGPPIGPSQAMTILNRAISDASKGRMMMTFFLAVIDKNTGVMRYTNASHEAPYLLKADVEKPSRSDYIPLNEVNNPRLGESPDIEFSEAEIQLGRGDRLVFYTDGVIDVKDTEKNAWGERRFLKALSNEFSAHPEAEHALSGLVHTLSEFRHETPLDDDVTLILCRFGSAA